MVNFDTPQSKAVKRLLDAYSSLDMKNVEPLISKDYQYESLPESTDLPKQTKESHFKMWGGVFSSVKKYEVRNLTPENCLQARRLISTTTRSPITK